MYKTLLLAGLLTLSAATAQSVHLNTRQTQTYSDAEGSVTMPFTFETILPDEVTKLYHDPIMLSYYEFLYDLAQDQGYAGNCYSRQLFIIAARTEAAFRQRQSQWVSALKTGKTRYGAAHWAKEPPFTNSTGRITGEVALLEKGKAGLMLGFYYNASAGKGYIATCALV